MTRLKYYMKCYHICRRVARKMWRKHDMYLKKFKRELQSDKAKQISIENFRRAFENTWLKQEGNDECAIHD